MLRFTDNDPEHPSPGCPSSGGQHHANAESAASRRVREDRGHRAAGPDRRPRGQRARRLPSHPVGVSQRPVRSVRQHGAAHRKGVRRQDGHAHANADVVRHRPHPQARRRRSRRALPSARGADLNAVAVGTGLRLPTLCGALHSRGNSRSCIPRCAGLDVHWRCENALNRRALNRMAEEWARRVIARRRRRFDERARCITIDLNATA